MSIINTKIIKNTKLNKFIIVNIVLLSVLSYEINIYNNYYSIFNILILISSFILIFSSVRSYNKNILGIYVATIKKNPITIFLLLSIMVNTMISSLTVGYVNYSSLFGVVSLIISIFIFYLLLPYISYEYIESIRKMLVTLITFSSIIGIIIGVRGSFFNYTLDGMRSASVFFDANYFSSLASIALLLSLKQKSTIGYIIGFINFIAIYYSGSRTAILGVIIVLFLSSLYYDKFTFKKILLILFISFLSVYAIDFLLATGYFRISQGLTGRENIWSISIAFILKEPIWGYGHGQVSRLLKEGSTLPVTSSHNYFIDYALMYGLPSLLINLSVLISGFIKGLKNGTPPYIIQVIFFLFLSMNSIVLSLGGVGALSLIFTIFLGISNSAKIKNMNEGNKHGHKDFIQ